ncbi:MFS-type transporter SLC18B1 [Amphibalanus amphitrite]|uniref:MFS-type transporter SLC18B1 n=1 Tax=Amphibalanus amphitrite TaxID=1232801 RepID=A0A6A4V9Z9_AMPAM|nr:MFS-type transporter SLC18B1 [Amphibalanus amphitrite]
MGWLAPRFGVARLYVLGSVFVGISTVVFGLLDYISQPVPFLAWSLINSSLDPTMESYMHKTLGIEPAELSLFFLAAFVGYTLSSPFWIRLSDKIDNTFLLLAACLAPTALGVLLISPSPILGLHPSRLLLGVGMTLREVFQVGAYLPAVPLMLRISTNRGIESNLCSQAMVSSVYGTTFSIGTVVGPLGGGLVIDVWGYPFLATCLGGFTIVLCVAMTARGIVYHVTRRTTTSV